MSKGCREALGWGTFRTHLRSFYQSRAREEAVRSRGNVKPTIITLRAVAIWSGPTESAGFVPAFTVACSGAPDEHVSPPS